MRTHTSPVQIRTMLARRPPVRIDLPGQGLSPRPHRCHPLADVPPGGGPRGGPAHHHGRPQGARSSSSPSRCSGPLAPALPAVVLSVHRAVGGGGRALLHVRRGRLPRSASRRAGSRSSARAWCIPTCCATCGYDPEEVTGWAFGMGVERIAMLKYGESTTSASSSRTTCASSVSSCRSGRSRDEDLVPLAARVRRHGPSARAARRPADQCRECRWKGSPRGGGPVRRGGRRDRGHRARGGRPAPGPREPALPRGAAGPQAVRSCAARPMPRRGCAPRWRRRARRLPGGRAITAATIRGTLSEGMLCSEKELGIGEDAAGILALPADAPLGADLATYLGLDDTIFEIEITPNRPDVLAHRGGGARGRRADRRALPLPAGGGEGRESRRRALAARGDRRPGPLPAVRRARHHRPHREALAALAGPAPPHGGTAPHQQRGGRDQLRAVGAGPAAPRVRPRPPRGRPRSSCAGLGPASASPRWTAASARWRRTC